MRDLGEPNLKRISNGWLCTKIDKQRHVIRYSSYTLKKQNKTRTWHLLGRLRPGRRNGKDAWNVLKRSTAENAIVASPASRPQDIAVLNHSVPPTPNNNIAITLNHTVLRCSNRREGKFESEVWNWMYFYIARCARPKTTFLAYIRLPLKTKVLPYFTASHLVCIGENMQSTPVCQWRATAWRM